MSNRENLHRLVDTLPEVALETASRVLQNYQTWPPQPPADIEKMRELVKKLFERNAMEHASRTGRGVVGGYFSRSRYRPDGDGAASVEGWEGETSVKVELRTFRGHRLELEERIRLSSDKRFLIYSQRIKGPKGEEDLYEKKFAVPENE